MRNNINSFKKIFMSLFMFFVFSCDIFYGEDGNSGIAYSWMGNISNVITDDSTIPSYFNNGQYYFPAETGTYCYSYIGEGEFYYNGCYSIYKEDGELIWVDGEDMCFELYMYSYIGPSFYEWTCDDEGVNISNENNSNTYEKYLNDVDNELNFYNDNQPKKINTLQKLNTNVSFSRNELDKHPNLKLESGNIGKYYYIHKYIIETINK